MARISVTGFDASGNPIVNVASPSGSTDAANKGYVDSAFAGVHNFGDHVRAATTANITLTGVQTVDGVSLIAGNAVLVKNQTSGSDNGTYIVGTGAWSRRDTGYSSGFTVTVTEGTTKGTGSAVANPLQWQIATPDPIVVGTTSTSWVAVSGGSTYTAGNGLTLAGSAFSAKATTGVTVSGSGIGIDTAVVVRKYASSIGDGATSTYTVTHNLATKDVQVTTYYNSSGAEFDADVIHATTNTVTIEFAGTNIPATNAVRVVVQG